MLFQYPRSQTADMAAIDMSITGIRQGAVDFTMPFMNTGNTFININYSNGANRGPQLMPFERTGRI